MSLLLDELRASAKGVGCSVCNWLAGRPAAEQAEWKEAFADQTISTRAIQGAMAKRGFTMTESPVKTHRQRHESH